MSEILFKQEILKEIKKILMQFPAQVYHECGEVVSILAYAGYLNGIKLLAQDKLRCDLHFNDELPLRYASRNGHIDIVKYLLQNGANVGVISSQALYWAAEKGHVEVVKVLLDTKENHFHNCKVAMNVAIENKHEEVVKLFFSYGIRNDY